MLNWLKTRSNSWFFATNLLNFVVVKILTIFVMFVVLGLSLIPCCSPGSQTIEKKYVENTSDCCHKKGCDKDNSKSENSGEKEECGSCSPFFACGSCIGFAFQSLAYRLTDLDFPSKITYCSYRVQFDSEYFNKMWQPPKIS